jgi:hypothetical protein
MSDHAELTALVHRAQQIAAGATRAPRRTGLLFDEKDRALEMYRLIAGICGNALERLRAQPQPVAPDTLELAQALLQVARLCTEEHDQICREEEQRRERNRRWSEVHDEFEAAQREGRPMRSDWSWERHARWEGPIT